MTAERPVVEVDLAIVGAGLSGLTLAHALLAHPGLAGRTLALVTTSTRAPKTVSYWTTAADARTPRPGPPLLPVEHTWSRVRLVRASGAREEALERYVIGAFDSAGFVDSALATLAGDPRVRLVRDRATRLDRRTVHTEDVLVRASRVFDSTPLYRETSAPYMQVEGVRLSVERPVFDPAAVTFLDTTLGSGAAFGYVLPISARHAVVQVAGITTTAAASPGPLHHLLERYCARLVDARGAVPPGAVHRLRSERGVIPLDTRYAGPAGVVPLGTNAGLIRTSTGYGLAAMVADAARLADAVARGRRVGRRRAGHSPVRLADAAMCRRIRRDPAAIGPLLDAVTGAVPADDLLTWLDGRLRPTTALRLGRAALPLLV